MAQVKTEIIAILISTFTIKLLKKNYKSTVTITLLRVPLFPKSLTS